MNKKGFMMAELVVVSSVIVITLTGLYISYNKIISSYRQIINYYDVGFYYKLGYYNMKLYKTKEDGISVLDKTLKKVDDEKYTNINGKVDAPSNESIYIVKNGSALNTLKSKVDNPTYKDYIEYLIDSKNIGNTYIIVGEQCSNDEKKCKYAYAEVANEEIK